MELKAPPQAQPDQGRDRGDLHGRRDRGLPGGADHRRLLGAVVRAVQDPDPGAGEGGHRGQGQGPPRQDRRRPEPADRGADAGAVDPGGLRLRRRPAGGRLHGRAGAGADQGLRRPVDRDVRRRRRHRGGAGHGRGDAGAGRRGGRGADLRGDPRPRTTPTSPRSPASPARTWRSASSTGRARSWRWRPMARRTTRRSLAARAQVELAEASAGGRRHRRAPGGRRAEPERPPGALRPGAGAFRRWRPRGGGRRAASSFSAATASGTRAPPRRSSSSSSTASARRARWRKRGGGGSAR